MNPPSSASALLYSACVCVVRSAARVKCFLLVRNLGGRNVENIDNSRCLSFWTSRRLREFR